MGDFEEVELPWFEGYEQTLLFQFAAVPVEADRLHEVGQLPLVSPQVGPTQLGPALGRCRREIDDDQMMLLAVRPAPGQQVAAGLVVGPSGDLEQAPLALSDAGLFDGGQQ